MSPPSGVSLTRDRVHQGERGARASAPPSLANLSSLACSLPRSSPRASASPSPSSPSSSGSHYSHMSHPSNLSPSEQSHMSHQTGQVGLGASPLAPGSLQQVFSSYARPRPARRTLRLDPRLDRLDRLATEPRPRPPPCEGSEEDDLARLLDARPPEIFSASPRMASSLSSSVTRTAAPPGRVTAPPPQGHISRRKIDRMLSRMAENVQASTGWCSDGCTSPVQPVLEGQEHERDDDVPGPLELGDDPSPPEWWKTGAQAQRNRTWWDREMRWQPR